MSTLIWAAAIAGLLIGLFGLFLCVIAGQSDRRAPEPPAMEKREPTFGEVHGTWD